MNKTILVTVADDRSGRKDGAYGKTQKYIESVFKSHPEFGITDYLMWNWDDIKNSKYYITYKNQLDVVNPEMNGRLYKSLVIKEGLSKIGDGDFLIYNDTSQELWKGLDLLNWDLYDLEVLKQSCIKNGGILTAHAEFDHDGFTGIPVKPGTPGFHTHEIFTRSECLDIMDPEGKYTYCLQHASGFVVLQKNEKSIKFVDDWIHYNTIKDCHEISISEPHRTDQSISGILINRLENKLIRCLLGSQQHIVINPYNLLSFCQKKTNYSFVDSIQQMQPKRIFIDMNKEKNERYIGKPFTDLWCTEYRKIK